MSKPADGRSLPSPAEKTLPMSVANMTFMVDRLGQDCAPLQYIRELTENAKAAILSLPDEMGEVIWDVDWNRHILTDTYKLTIIDTGVGMTGDEMVNYINKLSSSGYVQSATKNYGIGAKVAAAPLNREGLIYLSWKDGEGAMIHLWRDPATDQYGLHQFELPDGSFSHWAPIQDDIKPPQIKVHGTMVVLLGNQSDQDTMTPPPNVPMKAKWILRYLNARYFRFPEDVTVRAREGWELDRGDKHNFLRVVTGQGPWLDDVSEARGKVMVKGAKIHWWIVKEDADVNSGHYQPPGHVAALYQDELYELVSARAGIARLQMFGVIFGHNRVVIYVEPDVETLSVTPDIPRTRLHVGGEPLPWTEWAAEFREKMPPELEALINEISAKASGDNHGAIRDRLKRIADLFRLPRYRVTSAGKLKVDDDGLGIGGVPLTTDSPRNPTDDGKPGGRGGRAGDIYALFLKAKGVPGEEVSVVDQLPDVKWISVADGTRSQGDLEDRAAHFIPQVNQIQANADFRVFTEMAQRWSKKYSHAPAAGAVVTQVVQEWFEQSLVETVMGAQALRNSPRWSVEDMASLWSDEALTAAVLPRYHIDENVKRSLGQKLGSLKDV